MRLNGVVLFDQIGKSRYFYNSLMQNGRSHDFHDQLLSFKDSMFDFLNRLSSMMQVNVIIFSIFVRNIHMF